MEKTAEYSHGYKPAIDGLRAIAVIVVILFHLKITGFSGGYVGVDIFFVISGYLITLMLSAELDLEKFSLKNFYVRRVRRLAPALLVMLLVVLLVAVLTLKPQELNSFGLSLLWQSVSMQNIFFLAEGEYFVNSDYKPLLHTWSLAVEEQFYFFWPLFLIFLSRFQFKGRVFLLCTAIAFSFVMNLVFIALSPKASFFLAPTRAWQLAAGGLVALFEIRGVIRRALDVKVYTFFGAGGLALVGYSVVFLIDTNRFPGYLALVPSMGAMFLILSANDLNNPIGAVLSARPIVLLGKVSYPLYLWHWPAIVAMRHFTAEPTWESYSVVTLVTLLLSVATYRYIEMPIRSKKWLSKTPHLVGFVGGGFALLTAVGFHIWASDGASYRYEPAVRRFLVAPLQGRNSRCGIVFKALNPRDSVCTLRAEANATQRVLLWGNSHADQWSGLFLSLASESGTALYLNSRNCRVTPDHDFCGSRIQKSILDFVESQHVTDVVLASTGYGSYGVLDSTFEEDLKFVVGRLHEMRVRVWLVIDIPISDELNPVLSFERNPESPKLGSVRVEEYMVTKLREKRLFESLVEIYPGVRIIDPSVSLCDSKYCYGGRDAVIWYKDGGHLTDAGALAAGDQFRPIYFNQ